MTKFVSRFVKDESGATAIEYGLIAAGIAAVVITAVYNLGSKVNTTFTNITEFVGGGTGGFTIPASSSTGAANVVRMNVDLRGKKRYLKVNATPAFATRVVSVARLGKAEVGPVSASEVGVAAVVSG